LLLLAIIGMAIRNRTSKRIDGAKLNLLLIFCFGNALYIAAKEFFSILIKK
jgi:hypothetical protein